MLAPLKELESGETGGIVHLEEFQGNVFDVMMAKPQLTKTSEDSASQRCPDHANMKSKVASEEITVSKDVQTPLRKPKLATRNSLEDMELETRTLTEPLPTNQLVLNLSSTMLNDLQFCWLKYFSFFCSSLLGI